MATYLREAKTLVEIGYAGANFTAGYGATADRPPAHRDINRHRTGQPAAEHLRDRSKSVLDLQGVSAGGYSGVEGGIDNQRRCGRRERLSKNKTRTRGNLASLLVVNLMEHSVRQTTPLKYHFFAPTQSSLST